MSFHSDKNSGSTVKLTLWGRLFRRKGGSKKRDLGSENGRQNKVATGPTKNLEDVGYLRYGLAEGLDVYISTSKDDPFIDCDEPKPDKTRGRFLSRTIEETSEPEKLFKNALPEVKFTESDFEEKIILKDESDRIMTPQTAVTSSIETEMIEDSKVIDFSEEPLYDIEPVGNDGSVTWDNVEDVYEMDIERLPFAPARAEPSPSEVYSSEDVIVEGSKPVFIPSLPSTSKYLEIASPSVVLALPPSSQVLAVAAPAQVFLLPEPLASDEEIRAALEGTEESANALMATLPSGLYAEGVEPTADAVTFEEDVISVNAICPLQTAETSSSVEEILIDYVDYVGYDFLPEVTEPVRREPRNCEPTISQMPEYIEMDDEISGIMMLTIPELASDAFEVLDSSIIDEREIPEDGLEILGASIDSARNVIDENMDIGPMINEALKAATVLSVVLSEDDVKETVPCTLIVDDKIEEASMRPLVNVIPGSEEAYEEVLPEVSEDLLEVEEVRTIRPRISFIFGNGAKTYSFY